MLNVILFICVMSISFMLGSLLACVMTYVILTNPKMTKWYTKKILKMSELIINELYENSDE